MAGDDIAVQVFHAARDLVPAEALDGVAGGAVLGLAFCHCAPERSPTAEPPQPWRSSARHMVRATPDYQLAATGLAMDPSAKPNARLTISSLRTSRIADIASETGDFTLVDVLTAINSKLVRRHPHVFGDTSVSDAREVELNWEQLKAAERAEQGVRKSPVDGIPSALPALSYAQLMQDRVARVGFEWEDMSGILDKLVEEVGEFRNATTDAERVHELGDLFLVMVNFCRWLDVQAEDALRQANGRFRARYLQMEELAEQRGLDFAQLPLDDKEALWQEAKTIVG